MFLNKTDLYFDPQIQNGYRQHTNKGCFYAREL